MRSVRLVSILANKAMISAFSVLIASKPNLRLLAAADSLDGLQAIQGERKPDIILVYLFSENGAHEEKDIYDAIVRIKNTWPRVWCVVIFKHSNQLEKSLSRGVDIALLDGVNAERLLAAIEGDLM
jgi:DNA-binding NarL/FixJ family response regulator